MSMRYWSSDVCSSDLVEHAADAARDKDNVEIDADARRVAERGVGRADAANEDGGSRAAGPRRRARLIGEVRNRLADLRDAVDLLALEAFRRDRGYRDRTVLQTFLAAAGGDDDFIRRIEHGRASCRERVGQYV